MPMEKDADGFYTGEAVPEATASSPATSVKPTLEDDLVENQYDVDVTLADQQADPNSPLFSVKTFEELGLHENLLKGLFNMGFTKPSKIQERALPLLLSNPPTNMIGQSQSGTGKTAAFVLTMLSRIDYTVNKTQAICLTPSRELARQIMTVVTTMGKFTKVTTEYGIKEANQRDSGPITAHILVGTPGTVCGLLQRRQLDISALKTFVVDEADNMLDQDGLGDQTARVKSYFTKFSTPPAAGYQIVLFSATFPDHVWQWADRFAPKANKIALKKQEVSVANIRQFYIDCKNEEHKYEIIVKLYEMLTVGQSIIFCQHRSTADKIATRMITEGHKVASLHGAKDGAERDAIVDSFREGKAKVLITTNVVARGLDVMQVNMVVNYDIPLMGERKTGDPKAKMYFKEDNAPDVETYIHRIGRTGRFGRKGVSINFVHNEATHNLVRQIQEATGRRIEHVPTDDVDAMEEILKKGMK